VTASRESDKRTGTAIVAPVNSHSGDIAPVEEHTTTRRATRRPQGTMTVLAATEQPRIRTEVLRFTTTGGNEFWDLSDMTREVVERSGVRHGQVTIHTPHTTTTIVLNESETGFLNDFRRFIDSTVPVEKYYEHDDHDLRTENLQEDEYLNGHAHIRQLLVGSASVTIPVVDGEVLLGMWQKVLFAEFDQARERRVVIHAQGV
jgi:secondary thiamine-phosphate synthase enzyme